MILYSYWRSTTAYRVRIALALKGLRYDTQTVDLARGHQLNADYAKVNPIAGVPTLVLDDGRVLTQSMAILDYLDRTHPSPPFVPEDPFAAAQVRAAAFVIACDIHPLCNLSVTRYVENRLNASQRELSEWYRTWISQGLGALEQLVRSRHQPFCAGASPSLADVCLIPQLYNATRFNVDLTPFATLRRINEGCLSLKAFSDAVPERQPDAPESEVAP